VEVVHLGPLPPPAAPPTAPAGASSLNDDPFVLALGTLERRKNVPALVDAFARATGELRDLRLVLAGADGDDATAVGAAIERLDPARRARVHRLGPVTDAGKAWLLEHAAVLAYPSLDEGFGFPLLEAQQAGLPIVATRAGSIPEVGGEGAALVEAGDVDALAAALVRVTTDRCVRADLVAKGRANLARFDWQRSAAAIAALYRRLEEER
jgi:glycosyltransferase involved in cell wall biosynthesis